MSIEERASNVVRNVFHKEFWNDKVDADMRQIKNLMIEFATEQREIDIQRAVEWLKLHRYINHEKKYVFYLFNLDEFEKAMKGE